MDRKEMRGMTGEVAVLGELWRIWAEFGQRLDADGWRRPTRCEGWDVAALYAHVSQGVGGLAALVERRRADGPPEHPDAVALLRALKPAPEVARELAERHATGAVEDAAAAGTAELVRRMTDQAPRALALATGQEDTTVEYFRRGTTPLRAAVVLRLVEATVHLLDLADALGSSVAPPEEAVRRTAQFLLDLTPTVAFIEVATGRRDASIFPVHS